MYADNIENKRATLGWFTGIFKFPQTAAQKSEILKETKVILDKPKKEEKDLSKGRSQQFMETKMKNDMDTCRAYETKTPENSLFHYKTGENLLDKVMV